MPADILLYLEVYITFFNNGFQEPAILGLLELITSSLSMIGDISNIFNISPQEAEDRRHRDGNMRYAFKVVRNSAGFYLSFPRLDNNQGLPVGLAGEFTSIQYTAACRYLHTVPLPLRLSFLKVNYSQFGGRYSNSLAVPKCTHFILWYQHNIGSTPI